MNLSPFQQALKRFSGKRIVVLGDMVLDEYVSGSTERISREAPVLILRHEHTLELPGGGANPVSNVHSLGGTAFPVGVIGDDAAGDRLRQIFKSKGLDTTGLIAVPQRLTSRKVRVLAGGHNTARQQVIRVDYASEEPLPKLARAKILKALDERLKGADGLIVSDYGAGVMGDELLDYVNLLGRKHPKLVICVDSRYQLARYRNVTVITPNETEAAPAAGYEEYHEADLAKIGKKLLDATQAAMVLVTRGSKGMSLFTSKRTFTVPVYGSNRIVDVNGAGDSVASAMTLALTCGVSEEMAMKIANAAGGVAVMQAGPASVTRQEILALLKSV